MKLRLILGDQLSRNISSLEDADAQADIILMCEVRTEATYVRHHKKKITFIFSAMRHFAVELADQGFNVHYVKYDDPENVGSLIGEVARAIAHYDIDEVIVTNASEYRLFDEMAGWAQTLGVNVTIKNDNRFLCTQSEFATWAEGRKQLRMEFFYREMRRKYSVLMDHGEPMGGQWN